MFICSRFTLVKRVDAGIVAHPLFCRRWSCPICGPKRAWQLRVEATEGNPTTFLTLTVATGAFANPTLAARALVKCWRNIRQQAARELGIKKIPFLAVFEKTKRGWPHLHILCRAPFIKQSWISQKCARYIRSPIVFIERIASASKCARYVAKYCSKDPQIWDGVKRYWRSLDYAPKPDTPESDDQPCSEIVVLKKPYDEVRSDQVLSGVTVAQDIKGRWCRIGWWTAEMVFR